MDDDHLDGEIILRLKQVQSERDDLRFAAEGGNQDRARRMGHISTNPEEPLFLRALRILRG